MEPDYSVVWTVGPDEIGDRQMEIDQQMAHAAVASGKIFVRLYHFTPPCVSLGCFQRDDEVDPVRCQAVAIDITRRPTGGRAVLHKGDLVYSIAVPLSRRMTQVKGMFHVGVYNEVALALQSALNDLGLSSGSTEEQSEKVDQSLPRARLCFGSSTPYEVQIKGLKVVGSAQRKYRDVVLQHGSILISNDHLQLVELLPKMNELVRDRLRTTIDRQTTNLLEAGYNGDEKELISALEISFERRFGIMNRVPTKEFMELISCSRDESIMQD
jgi:lipoyl(octanoyl) transferase